MDTKSRIMEEAFKLFLKKGFDDVSLSEIKKEADITTGGFYYYFTSKDDLIVSVIERYIFNYFDSTINQIRKCQGKPKEKLRTVISSIIGETKLSENSEKIDYKTLHLLLMEAVKKFETVRKEYSKFYYNLLNLIKDIVDEGVVQGTVRRDIDSNELATIIETTMAGNVIIGIAMPEISLKDRINSSVDNLWELISK